jgi:hypothetical protein
MPHISYNKSDEIPPTLDRLHVLIDLRPPRVEAGPSVIAQMNPLSPQNETGDEDLKRVDDTGNPFRRQSRASEADQPRLYPSPLIQGENTSPSLCSHKIHDPVRSACLQCIANFEADLQNVLPELLRQLGWSGEQIKGFLEDEQRSNTNAPLSRLLPKGDGSYEEQEREWQVNLTQEMNRKIESAETRRRAARRG